MIDVCHGIRLFYFYAQTKEKKEMKQVRTKKRTGSAKNKKDNVQALRREIISITLLAASLFILLSIFTSQMGIVGSLVRTLFIGLLGIGGYVLPLIGMGVAIYYLRGELEQVWRFIVFGLPFVLILSTFLHTFYYGQHSTYSLLSLGYIENASWANGGYIGALLATGAIQLIGISGTYILLIVLIGLEFILLTEFPLFSWLEKQLTKSCRFLLAAFREYAPKHSEPTKKIRREKKPEPIFESREEERVVPTVSEKIEAEHPPIYLASENTESSVQSEKIIPMEKRATALTQEEYNEVSQALEQTYHPVQPTDYHFPSIELLKKSEGTKHVKQSKRDSLENAKKLEETLKSFGVEASVIQINQGPTVTRYELQPKQGVKVSKIVNLADDIALNLAASGIRIEAPIPGKAAVGIEIPNESSDMVYLRDVLESDNFKAYPSKLAFALGKDIAGKNMVTDIAKMPHILIAGATGSGKSVCINTLITSILYKATPSEVKLIMIDPKVVELNVYNGIPHLLIPVVTDPKKAAGALCWAVNEMTKRYNLFAEANVRDMRGYNEKADENTEKMPHIVIIIDELADLMMTAAKEVEDAICRLAQMARAAGLHLVIATQRPSVDVITGIIKANIPSRLAFAVSSGVDSRTILDTNGAEKLLGRGDMLFYPIGESKPIRIQGAFISDKEVESIVEAVKANGEEVHYEEDIIQTLETPVVAIESSLEDELIPQAIELAKTRDKLSISMLQRYFRIGFNRASRLMESLEERGIVGPDEGSKPRKVLK
jgi:S-DNA-T family DNA segregation ATPase FtsK/SpoIIIE